MPKNEEGEFELVLGNKQLLSVFFIVVVLLGVFFTMGYIVGRNSPLATAETSAADKKESKPMVVDSASRGEPAKESPKEDPVEAKKEEAAPAPKETAPQQPESKPAEHAAAKPAPLPPAPAPAREKAKPEPPKPVAQPRPAEHANGTYLQLAATSQREADAEVDVLRSHGFHAISSEIPEKPGTFRVLVGPVPESGLNKMRTDLENAGFPAKAAIRRTL
jgi:outer membrane biosynthesis protein TonB